MSLVFRISAAQAYNLSQLSYSNRSLQVASKDSDPHDLHFDPTGTILTITGEQGKLTQYTLSTAWDVSTAVFTRQVNTGYGGISGMSFNPAGTVLILSSNNSDSFISYTLTTPWDVSTRQQSPTFADLSTQDWVILGHAFNSTGTAVYVTGSGTNKVYKYTLTTPWDIATLSYSGTSVTLAIDNAWGLAVSADDTLLFVVNNSGNSILKFSLVTNTLLSTTSTAPVVPVGLTFSPTATNMYVMSKATDTIYQYS